MTYIIGNSQDKAMNTTRQMRQQLKTEDKTVSDLTEVNAWTAEKCGLTEGKQTYWLFDKDGHNAGFTAKTWTILDPRCLFIVINHLLSRHHSNAFSVVTLLDGCRAEFYLHNERIEAEGNTPESALVACIVAIWESEK